MHIIQPMEWVAGTYIGCEMTEPYSSMSFTAHEIDGSILQRISNTSYNPGKSLPLSDLRYLQIPHYADIHGDVVLGEMICNKSIAEDLLEIFHTLFEYHYPIGNMRLVDYYGADDDKSMLANNTSCFNHRPVVWSRSVLSKHALGLAVDINPLYNPCVRFRNEHFSVSPKGSERYADRSMIFDFKISPGDLCCREFKKHGFRWGGDWIGSKDYQHFEKLLYL